MKTASHASSCHCIALRKAMRRLSSFYDDRLEPLGINIAQFSLLRNIRSSGSLSVSDLGQRVDLDRSTVGRNIKVLAKMGLVAFASGKDQRESLVSLTEAGQQRLRDADPLWDETQRQIEGRLGPEGIEKLHELLAAL